MQDRSINVGGSFHGIANTGDDSVIQNNLNHNLDEEMTTIFREMLQGLAKRYPAASELQKQTVFQMELQQKLRENPTLKQKFISASKAGGVELVKVLTNNPFVSVPMETIKGWIEAESS